MDSFVLLAYASLAASKTLLQRQGATIDLCCICIYPYFYWCTGNFGHVYVDSYAHFFTMIF